MIVSHKPFIESIMAPFRIEEAVQVCPSMLKQGYSLTAKFYVTLGGSSES